TRNLDPGSRRCTIFFADREPAALPAPGRIPDRDDFSSNRHLDLTYAWSMIFSENRYPLFGIMLWLSSMADDAERIIGLYDRHARSWDGERGRSLFERPTWPRIRVAADSAAAPSGWHA